jgi:glutaredoxin
MYKVLGHAQCAYCKQAIQLLATKGKSFTYLDVRSPENADALAELKAAGMTTVPQIFYNDEHIGDFNTLKQTL